jgi:hypothetical protein
MMTFAEEIEAVAEDEDVKVVVIGPYGWTDKEDEDEIASKRPKPVKLGEVLSWDEARPMLDYDFDRGFGGPECDSIFAYTTTRVLLYVWQYDGATGVNSIPRDPEPCIPNMPGG